MAVSQLQRILAIEALVLLTQASCAAPWAPATNIAISLGRAAANQAAHLIERRAANPYEMLPAETPEDPLPEEQPGNIIPPGNNEPPGNYDKPNPFRSPFAEMLLANALNAEWRYNAIIGRNGPIEADAQGMPRMRGYYSTREEFLGYNPGGVPLALEFRLDGAEPSYAQLSIDLEPKDERPFLIRLVYMVGYSDGKGNRAGVKQQCGYEWTGEPASAAVFKVIADSFEREGVVSKAALETIIARRSSSSSGCAREPRETPRHNYRTTATIL